jgi:hypothetical protein
VQSDKKIKVKNMKSEENKMKITKHFGITLIATILFMSISISSINAQSSNQTNTANEELRNTMIGMAYSHIHSALYSLENLQHDEAKKQLNLASEQISQIPIDKESTERTQEIEQLSDEISTNITEGLKGGEADVSTNITEADQAVLKEFEEREKREVESNLTPDKELAATIGTNITQSVYNFESDETGSTADKLIDCGVLLANGTWVCK